MINYPEQVSAWLKSERQKASSSHRFKKGFIGARLYSHFDAPISLKDNPATIKKLEHRLSHVEYLRTWPFFPFILHHQRIRRYRHKEKVDPEKSAIAHRDQKKSTHLKSRPIMVAAHQDACLLAFQSFAISPYYEKLLAKEGLQDNVVAYRSIEGKNNVDFAKKAFEYMQSHDEMACILVDIKGFFDNIDHSRLRAALCSVLKVKALPDEIEYTIKNLTTYRFIEEDKLFRELKHLKKPYFIKIPNTNSATRLCKIEDFNRYIDNSSLIQKNVTGRGIPQGSPISGLLANISLLEFDGWMRTRLKKYDIQFYQRYSDDIIIVCPVNQIEEVYRDLLAELKNHGVTVSTKKTEAFTIKNGKLTNVVDRLERGASTRRQNVQYLGLEWNGEQITLRPSTISRRLRPGDSRKLKPKLWGYHESTFRKINNSKAIKRQYYKIRRVIKTKFRQNDKPQT